MPPLPPCRVACTSASTCAVSTLPPPLRVAGRPARTAPHARRRIGARAAAPDNDAGGSPAANPAPAVAPGGGAAATSSGGNGGPLAVGAAALGAVAFIAARVLAAGSGTSLADVAAGSLPLDAALANGRPTVVEFYADYCEVCHESAPQALAAQRAGAGTVNYVLLNVDNSRWAPEVAEYGVRGVPHWQFLDGGGGVVGRAVGRLPPGALVEDVEALAAGRALPVAVAEGEATPVRAAGSGSGGGAPPAPRAHG